MHKILFVLGITFICLAAQVVCAQVLGVWLTPNFLLIAVVFFGLYRGLRYSLWAAFLGGFFLDSFSGNTAGINVFSFVMCAFFTAWMKMNIYQPGAAGSRVLIIFIIAAANSLLQYFYVITKTEVGFGEAFFAAIFPGVFFTTIAGSYTFERLKQCALRLFA